MSLILLDKGGSISVFTCEFSVFGHECKDPLQTMNAKCLPSVQECVPCVIADRSANICPAIPHQAVGI